MRRPGTLLRCVDCGLESEELATGWRAYLTASDEEANEIEDPIYVLSGPDEGYVEFYDDYLAEVKDGKKPK